MTGIHRKVLRFGGAPVALAGLLLSLLGCGNQSAGGNADAAGGDGPVQPDVRGDANADTPLAPDADGGGVPPGDTVAPGPPCATVDDCRSLQDGAGPCRTVACAAKGYCRYENLPDFGACDDGDPCTADTVCVTGRCALGGPVVCNDDNPCTADRCVAPDGCENTPLEGPCDDGDACTADDQCAAGVCAPGAALDCDDQNACTADRCDTAVGCVHTATEDPCDDGDPCTTDDACRVGVCVGGTPVVCRDDDPCTDGVCGPDGCAAVPNTAYCDDGNGCTSGDRCAEGVCVPGPNLCRCSVDADCADQGDGNRCNGTLVCENGGCVTAPETAVVCDTSGDGPCTLTACVPETGECATGARPDGTACDDASVCTTDDACTGGQCAGLPTVACNDDDACTSDACDPTAGCVYTPIAGCTAGCGDGDCLDTETCSSCPADCGPCPAVCPNGTCEDGETCASCPEDCGACVIECGNGQCEAGEDCANCPDDCGACPPECGNTQCEAGEDCTNCPDDCGACPPVCGDGTCNGAETATRCHRDCAPDWMQPGAGAGFHGTTFFGDMDACRTCHGQNLDGGVRSCNLCHPTWRTDCTFCHGGLDNQTGAPPEGVDGETQRTQRQVGAHTAHVTASARKVAYDCSVCHTVPAEVFSPGHIDGDGQAEVALDDCRGGSYAPANATCSGVYCHSNGRSATSGGSALWTGLGLTCNSCHPPSGLSGRHDDHLEEGVACAVCHNRTVNYSGAIIDATLHVNCAKDVSGPFTWNAGTRGCSNIAGCHGAETWGGGAAGAGAGLAGPPLSAGTAAGRRSGGY